MTTHNTLRILAHDRGTPFKLSTVERELRELWQEASRTDPASGAVIRACVHNLIVWAEAGGVDAEGLVRESSREQPGRVFLLVLDPALEEGTIWSEVSAVCHLRRGGGHICGEQIRLSCHPDSARLLPSVVQSLLLGELPVILWCTEGFPLHSNAFDRLVGLADRVIFDSAPRTSRDALLPALGKVSRSLKHRQPVEDLQWARLAPWREQLADIFDPLSRRQLLPHIRRIEIDQAEAALPSPQTAYLAGWLAARLGWNRAEGDLEAWKTLRKSSEDAPAVQELVFSFPLPEHQGQIRIRSVPDGGTAGAVLRLRLHTVDETRPEHLLLKDEEGYLQARPAPHDHAPLPSPVSTTPPTPEELLARTLQSRRLDAHYADALPVTLKMLEALEPDHV